MELKGLKLTLDMDIEKFKSGVNAAVNSTKSLDNEIKQLAKSFKFDPTDIQVYQRYIGDLQKKYEKLEDVFTLLQGKLQNADVGSDKWLALKDGIAQVGSSMELVDKEMNKAKELFAEMNTTTGISEKNYDKVKEALRKLDSELDENEGDLKDSKKSTDDLKRSNDDLGDSLDDNSHKLNIFGNTLKAITLSDVIKGGLNLLKDGLQAVWNGIKKIGTEYYNLMKGGIEYNAQMQGYETTLAAILDDKGAAGKLVKNLRQVGIEFGFDTNNLLEMSTTLLAAGENADDVQQSIRSVVSVLSLFGKGNAELKRVSQNLLQIKQRGTATERDLKEFANNGIPIYKMLADYSEKYDENLKATEVSYRDIVGAIYQATSDVNSIYAQAGEIRQQTFTGQMDRLEAGWQLLWADMAEDTTSTLTTEILPAINDFMAQMLDAFENGYNGETGMAAVVQVFKDNIGELVQTLTDSGILNDFLDGAIMIADAIMYAFEDEETKNNLTDAVEKFLNLITDWIVENIDIFVEAGAKVAEAFVGAFIEYVNKNLYNGYGSYAEMAMARAMGEGGFNINEIRHGGSGGNFSGGFGSLQSGGYSNQITLNASFIANGNLDEAQALRFADLISERVNENLGNMI